MDDRRVREEVYRVAGLNIAAKVWGEGYPCIALHGWLDNAASFDLLAHGLRDFKVIALDFPGHGLSSHRAEGYHFVDYAKDVSLLLEHLGLSQCHLIGHSMGGGVAALVAAALPGRIRRLILLESVGAITTETDEAPDQLRKAVGTLLAYGKKTPPVYDHFDAAVAARQRGGFGLGADAAKRLCRRGLVEKNGKYHWRTDQKVTLPSLLRLTEAQASAFAAAITAPVCILLAEQGIAQSDPAWVQRRSQAFSNARIQYLPGGHHFHMEDTVSRMLEIIQAFLHE